MNGNFNAFQYVQNQCFARMLANTTCPQPLQTLYNTYRLCNASNFYEYYNSFYALYNAMYYPQPVPTAYYAQYPQYPQYMQPVASPYYAQPVYAVPVRR